MPASVQNLKITFLDIPKKGDVLSLSYWGDHPTDSVEFVRGETFQEPRVYPGETTVGTSINDQATLYGYAFQLDYGSNFEVVVIDNVVYLRATNGSGIFNYSFNGNEGTVIFSDEAPQIQLFDGVVRSPFLVLSQSLATFDSTTFNVKVYTGEDGNHIDEPVLFSKIKKKVQRGQSIIYSNISYLVREGFAADINYYINNQWTTGMLPIRDSEGKWCHVEMTNRLFDTVQNTEQKIIYITDGYIDNDEVQLDSLGLLNHIGSSKSISIHSPERFYFKTRNFSKIQYIASSSPTVERSIPDNGRTFDWHISDQTIASVGVVANTGDIDIFEEKWIKFLVQYYDAATDEFTTFTKQYWIIQECQNQVWDLIFKDKTGFLQTLPLTKKSTKVLNVTSEDYHRNIVDINGSYDVLRHTDKQFNTNGGEQWTLNTDYIPEFNNDVIRQAMLSEEMWIRNQTTFEIHPVTRMDDSVTFKTKHNDKLINYTLKVKLSHKTIKSFK